MFQHFSLKNITTEVIVLTDVMNFFYLLVPVLFHVRQRVVRTYLSICQGNRLPGSHAC